MYLYQYFSKKECLKLSKHIETQISKLFNESAPLVSTINHIPQSEFVSVIRQTRVLFKRKQITVCDFQ